MRKISLSALTKLSTGAVLAFLSTTALSSENNIVISGGELDPGFTGAEIYLTDPTPAQAQPGTACELVESYVEGSNSGDYRNVSVLFDDEAVILGPAREVVRGKKQVDSFYKKKINGLNPTVVAVSYVGDELDCMVALSAQVKIRGETRFALAALDHFTVGESGKFVRMVNYPRPPRVD